MDRLNALFDRYRGPLLVLVPILITLMTSAAAKVIASSAPISALQAQDRKLATTDTTLMARLSIVEQTLVLGRQADSVARVELNRRVEVLLVGQCFERTVREIIVLQKLVDLDCSAVRGAR
ncbi:MAG: hypothetical protein HOP28_12180 [Gemmatimonadales bacterium]|nr:hypothetical protein [Gemmatimonadales bacterium]